MAAEFLPLCDVLFNVISLAGYFCDVVFDVVMGYALLERGYKGTFAAAISIVITSLLISQVISLRWYLNVWWGEDGADGAARKARPPWAPLALHCLALGVVWRYARLLLPVQLGRVKHQVRDLCMLRLVHAFCEAAPMLLLQLHVLLRRRRPPSPPELGEPAAAEPAANAAFEELNVISAALSLFSVCWALASFSKNVRRHNVHRLLLTWLGVIFQFLWRLGTISARVCALTVYALVYEYWVFLVIGLHWVSMFLWLISPKSVFHGEAMSRARKAALAALIAYVYVFAYINLQEMHVRRKMVTFYVVMGVENWLLVGAWWVSAGSGAAPAAAAAAFAAGLAAMALYYRYFHVRRLGAALGGGPARASLAKQQPAAAAVAGVFNCRFAAPSYSANGRKKKKPTSFVPPPAAPASAPATAPAPAPAAAFWKRPLPAAHNHHGGSSENEGSSVGSRVNIQQKLQEKKQKQLAELRVIEEEIKQGKLAKTAPVPEEIYSSHQPIPRAKTHGPPHPCPNYPLYPTYTHIKPPYTEINEQKRRFDRSFYENPARLEAARTPLNYLNETRSYEANGCASPRTVLNNSPRTYIADVPPTAYESENRLQDKTRTPNGAIYPEDRPTEYGYCQSYKDSYISALNALNVHGVECVRAQGPLPSHGHALGRKVEMRRMQRCRTPEILLAPHYLEGCNRQICCHWGPPYASRKKEESAPLGGSSGDESATDGRDTRPPSDIDSQISLPRSYTLPREFRYWRRRPPSNDSSDGDVDSGDNGSGRSGGSARRAARPRRKHQPETEL